MAFIHNELVQFFKDYLSKKSYAKTFQELGEELGDGRGEFFMAVMAHTQLVEWHRKKKKNMDARTRELIARIFDVEELEKEIKIIEKRNGPMDPMVESLFMEKDALEKVSEYIVTGELPKLPEKPN